MPLYVAPALRAMPVTGVPTAVAVHGEPLATHWSEYVSCGLPREPSVHVGDQVLAVRALVVTLVGAPGATLQRRSNLLIFQLDLGNILYRLKVFKNE